MTARKKTTRKKRPDPTAQAEAAGAQYAQDQLDSDYFRDWVRDQLYESSRMDPNDVLPLETKADAMKIAKNMLQQLKWDTKRALRQQDIEDLIGGKLSQTTDQAFFNGFEKALEKSREWLADELLEIKSEMGERRPNHLSERHRSAPIARIVIQQGDPSLQREGYTRQQALNYWVAKVYDSDGNLRSGVNSPDKAYVEKKIAEWFPGVPVEYGQPELRPGAQRRARKPVVRDYIAVDRRDHPVGPRHKGYSDAKREADAAGGVVKFVPSGARETPKAGRSVLRRRH